MSLVNDKDRLYAIEVIKLSDEAAAQWLKENAIERVDRPYLSSEEEIHKIASFAFARRKSSLLRLIVAQHGSHIKSLRHFFQHGTNAERLAILSNPLIGPFEREKSWVRGEKILFNEEALDILSGCNSRQREFSVFLSNPHINRDWLNHVIAKWNEIDCLDHGDFWLAVLYLADNPVVSNSYDDKFLDGYAEYSYQRLNLTIANLLQTAPVTIEWAYVLGKMLNKLYLPFVPDFEVNLIDRWKDPEPTEDGENLHYTFLREQITRYLIVRDHRSEIKDKYTIDHSDSAVRKGLYNTLSPHELFQKIDRGDNFTYPSFRETDKYKHTEPQQQVVDICQKCFERDKNDFVEGLIRNENFWKSQKEREFLHDLAWNLAEDPHYHMDAPNVYDSMEAHQRENNPNFFKDDDLVDIQYENTVEGKIEKLEASIEKLRDDRELADKIETGANRSFEVLSHELLTRIRVQSGLLWILIIVLGLYLVF